MFVHFQTGLALFIAIFVAVSAPEIVAQSTLISLSTRRDLVFDHSGNFLYVSTSDGFVRRFNIGTGQFDLAYNLGGSLNGLDIALDDSFLIVAQNAVSGTEGIFYRVDLRTGDVRNINYTRASGEGGGWDVAIGANNIALITTGNGGSSSVPLRQIDLATNIISIRTDANGSARMPIVRSADASRMYLMDTQFVSARSFSYSASSNTFGPSGRSTSSLNPASAAIDRTGSVIATRIRGVVSFDTAPGLNYLRSAYVDGGVAFDATQDRFYGVSSATDQIIARDATSYAELYRLNIGENLNPEATQFGTGNLVASNDGRFVALETPTGIRLFALPTVPSPSVAPAFGTPRDMVFDHAGQYLYIATAEGLIWPYNLLTSAFGTPYDLGGTLWGIDIAPDDSFLIVAQGETGVLQGAFPKVDLAKGVVTNLTYTRGGQEGGAYDVKIASNGLALTTTNYDGSGSTPVRQINLSTGELSERTDLPVFGSTVSEGTPIHRSADGTLLCFYEYDGPLFTYSAVSDSFSPARLEQTDLVAASVAVNRNGSLLATRRYNKVASLNRAPDFGFVQSFDALIAGVAFDAQGDTLYGVSRPTGQIVAYDTNTFAERFRFNTSAAIGDGRRFNSGSLIASPDGRYLAAQTSTGFQLYNLPVAAPLDLRVEVQVLNDVPQISFLTTAGRFYRVEFKNALSDTDWMTVRDADNVSGTGEIIQISDAEPGVGNLPQRFYQVALLLR